MNYDFSSIKKHSLERIAQKKLVGCGSMISIGGEKVWEDYTGMASVEKNEPIRPDSIYRLASMSKPVTGVAVMQLVAAWWATSSSKPWESNAALIFKMRRGFGVR